MQRREFIAAVATTAVAAAAPSTLAAHAPAAPTRPAGTVSGGYAAVEAAAAACIDAADSCLERCFAELATSDGTMAACADAAFALVAACRAVKTLAAAKSPHVPSMATAVVQVALACRTECDKFPAVAECVALGEACESYVETCRFTARERPRGSGAAGAEVRPRAAPLQNEQRARLEEQPALR